jgi:hypothetical protein
MTLNINDIIYLPYQIDEEDTANLFLIIDKYVILDEEYIDARELGTNKVTKSIPLVDVLDNMRIVKDYKIFSINNIKMLKILYI